MITFSLITRMKTIPSTKMHDARTRFTLAASHTALTKENRGGKIGGEFLGC